MAETLTEFFREMGLSPYAVVAVVSMLPFVELRGGLIAAAILNIPWYFSLPVCFAANMLPIPFILLFIRKIFHVLKRIGFLRPTIDRLESKARKKGKNMKKGWLAGLVFFVGIPLPGTGAWTGALIADLFDIRIRHSLPAIAMGVALAGVIMLVVSYFIPGLFGF